MTKKLKAALYTLLIMVILFILFCVVYAYPIIASMLLVGGGSVVFIGAIYNIIYINLKD